MSMNTMRRLSSVLAAAVLAALAGAARAEPALNIPPLDVRERVLANGLTVLSLEDHASPTTAIQVWYRVGAKDDPQGRSGFAHLFEHLMFKRTKNLVDEQFDRMTEDVGGANNASTGDDVTNYLNVVPSNHLERLLWAEAERLSNLTVDEGNFKSERAVVQEEFRTSVLTPPYGRFEYAMQQNSWAVHPYQRSTIGSIEDLDAATLDDVRAFHRDYYRTDNAALVVTGDFDPKQLDAWVDRYFGKLPKPVGTIKRVTAVEPERMADRRVTVHAPNVPLPALGFSWLAPPPNDADVPALKLAASLLSDGESSRLHQALVYRLQVAQQVDVTYLDNVDRGLVMASVVAASGQPLAKIETAFLNEIDRLANRPIPAAELDKARTVLLTRLLAQRETVEGRAYAIGEAWLQTGSAKAANTSLTALLAVTAADVQRVLKQQILGHRRLTLEYLDEAPASTGAAK